MINEDDDLYLIKQPVIITTKFNHTWIESVKKLPKWIERKQKIEELVSYINQSANVDCKDLFEICNLIKHLLNDNILAINYAGMKLVNCLCAAGRKGFKQPIRSEICQILLSKLKDKKL
jgi:hypothetical protein